MQILYDLPYTCNLKKVNSKKQNRAVAARSRGEGWEKRERWSKGTNKRTTIRYISSESIVYSVVTAVDNVALYI